MVHLEFIFITYDAYINSIVAAPFVENYFFYTEMSLVWSKIDSRYVDLFLDSLFSSI
jgi:hypothetical protein